MDPTSAIGHYPSQSSSHGQEETKLLCCSQRIQCRHLFDLVSVNSPVEKRLVLILVALFFFRPECEQQVKGAKGAIYEGFDKHEDAIAYIKQYNWNSGAESAPQKLNSTPSNSAREQIEEAPWFAGEVATEKQQEKCKTDSFEAVTSGSKPGTDLVVTENSKVRTVEVYTDGASSSNGKSNAQAGWGVYWPESENPASDLFGRNESGRLPGAVQTNNRGELMGIIRAIQLCPDPTAQLIIYSDSQYSIKGEITHDILFDLSKF